LLQRFWWLQTIPRWVNRILLLYSPICFPTQSRCNVILACSTVVLLSTFFLPTDDELRIVLRYNRFCAILGVGGSVFDGLSRNGHKARIPARTDSEHGGACVFPSEHIS
jgi:hypothetical protein